MWLVVVCVDGGDVWFVDDGLVDFGVFGVVYCCDFGCGVFWCDLGYCD